MIMLFDANTRATARMRHPLDDFVEVMEVVDDATVHGRPPVKTRVYATTFTDPPKTFPGGVSLPIKQLHPNASLDYSRNVSRFVQKFGLRNLADCANASCGVIGLGRVSTVAAMRQSLNSTLMGGLPGSEILIPKNARIVDLGDEITLQGVGNTSDAAFQQWCNKHQLNLSALGCERWQGCQCDPQLASCLATPQLFYFSSRFLHDAALATYRAVSQLTKQYLPKTKTGANFSPSQTYTDQRTGTASKHKYIGEKTCK